MGSSVGRLPWWHRYPNPVLLGLLVESFGSERRLACSSQVSTLQAGLVFVRFVSFYVFCIAIPCACFATPTDAAPALCLTTTTTSAPAFAIPTAVALATSCLQHVQPLQWLSLPTNMLCEHLLLLRMHLTDTTDYRGLLSPTDVATMTTSANC